MCAYVGGVLAAGGTLAHIKQTNHGSADADVTVLSGDMS